MTHPYRLVDEADIPSPALVFYPEFIRRNVARVVEMAGDPARLRPHVKTHKTRELVRMQVAAGVAKHKCATVAEAEVLASAGATDVLLAYPVVGPTASRLAKLAALFPGTRFSALVDSDVGLAGLADAARHTPLGAFLDLNVGMDRTGIAVGDAAAALYARVAATPNLTARGLHAYDGHNHQGPVAERAAAAEATLRPVLAFRDRLSRDGQACAAVVAGGTPTFPMYAAMAGVRGLECSPGTYVLHDYGYGSRHPDFTGITPAAVLLTRVIAKPTPTRVTLDLGNKAVAADPLLVNRVRLLGVPDYKVVGQSEEHLMVETAHAAEFRVGQVVYALPGHVCPTCALHREALVAEGGRVVGAWAIAARDRFLSV